MNKIWYVLMTVILLVIGVAWYRSRGYAVAFFMPIDDGKEIENVLLFRGLREAFLLGLDDANVTRKLQIVSADIPSRDNEALPVIKNLVKHFLQTHTRLLWKDEKLLIVAGFLSSHLKAAQEVVSKLGRNVLCVSPTSTTPQATKWKNVLQMVHNDNFAAQAVAMFVRRKHYDKIALLYIPGDVYSQGYCDELSQALAIQDVAYKTIAYTTATIEEVVVRDVNKYLQHASKPAMFFAGFSGDLIRGEKKVAAHVSLLCSDGCNDLGDIFSPHREVVVVVPSFIDYTVVTRSVYQRVFKILENKIRAFDYTVSYAVPFMYDFSYQLGNMVANSFELKWRYFELKIDAAKPNAALDSTWYTARRNGPAHGGYWFIYTHDLRERKMAQYRQVALGNTYTLPHSAAVAYQIGYFSWAGLLGWNMYQNVWEDYYKDGILLASKLSYENCLAADGTINWAPFHVKKFRDVQGKWWFASDFSDQYPLDHRTYALT